MWLSIFSWMSSLLQLSLFNSISALVVDFTYDGVAFSNYGGAQSCAALRRSSLWSLRVCSQFSPFLLASQCCTKHLLRRGAGDQILLRRHVRHLVVSPLPWMSAKLILLRGKYCRWWPLGQILLTGDVLVDYVSQSTGLGENDKIHWHHWWQDFFHEDEWQARWHFSWMYVKFFYWRWCIFQTGIVRKIVKWKNWNMRKIGAAVTER